MRSQATQNQTVQRKARSRSGTYLITLALALMPLLAAAPASAISFTLAGADGQAVNVGDQVTVTVTLDTESTLEITLMSIAVLFDDTRLSYNQAASSSNDGSGYVLYDGAAKNGGNYLFAAITCGGGFGSPTAGAGCQLALPGQVNVDYLNVDLANGTGAGNVGVSLLATLVFDVIGPVVPGAEELAFIELSSTSPGNVVGQPGGGVVTPTLDSGAGLVSIGGPAPTATAIPVDLFDETTRTIVVEVVNNSGVESSGVYAGDPAATFGPLGDATYSVAAGVGTITISAAVWEAFLISGFGESLSPAEVGVVPGTATANVMTIDIASGLPGPTYNWAGTVRADIPALGTAPTEIPIFGIYTNTAYLGDRFPGAPPNTDWWYQPDPTGALVNSCREYRVAPFPLAGQCDIADFRGDEAYNPDDGTFTFLGLDSNQFVGFGFASPNYALLRYRITEVGVPLQDSDGDGVDDLVDNCLSIPNPGQEDTDNNQVGDACNDSEDADGDEWADTLDNCLSIPNPGQEDQDADLIGDVCDDDRDGDGVPNSDDLFPDDPTRSQDTDSDGVDDLVDNCPSIPNPGQANLDGDSLGDACDDDRDGDGVPNFFDTFPDDPTEVFDTDSDGTGDNGDNCLADANPGQEDQDGDLIGDVCDPDRDGDGQPNAGDNCPTVANPGQEDTDANGLGNACNSAEDADGDDWADGLDNCPADFNPDQADLDTNGVGDACEPDLDGDGVLGVVDNCPADANPGQEDTDGNGLGDACNTAEDADADEWADGLDNCPADANPDQTDGDGDTVGDACDNCPLDVNPGQTDTSSNGTGDICNDEDLDGLRDSVETGTGVLIDENDTGTHPLNPDTDNDGLGDGLEVLDYGSDPHNPDTDGDTVIDGADNCVLVANTDQADANAEDDDNPATPAPFVDHYGDVCDADINNDGIVNTADFFGHFRPCFGLATVNNPQCATADFDGSGSTNTGDFFGYFLAQFGGKPGPGTSAGPVDVTFTTCGQTGRTGPSQAQCDAAYAGTDLEGKVTVVGGIQEWVVPYSGTYAVEAAGAQGGNSSTPGGLGARMNGGLPLTAGQSLRFLAGQIPTGPFGNGGGGGSFVTFSDDSPLLIAGGGGGGAGACCGGQIAGLPGLISETGSSGSGGGSCTNGSGGAAGAGGFGTFAANGSGGGGGLLTSGSNGSDSGGGASFVSGGVGGTSFNETAKDGGFGGGAGATSTGGNGTGGGGGGYSGGGGACSVDQYGSGGGGGSYNAGTNQDNASGANPGPGQVTITSIAPAPQAAQAQAPVSAASLNINALWDRDLDGVLDTTDNCLETPNPRQLDADGDGFGNACDADLNGDGLVRLDDVAAILAAMEGAGDSLHTTAQASAQTPAPNPAADLNGDGFVGLDDAAAALGALGTAPGPGAALPML